jgi:hypothetical protein
MTTKEATELVYRELNTELSILKYMSKVQTFNMVVSFICIGYMTKVAFSPFNYGVESVLTNTELYQIPRFVIPAAIGLLLSSITVYLCAGGDQATHDQINRLSYHKRNIEHLVTSSGWKYNQSERLESDIRQRKSTSIINFF